MSDFLRQIWDSAYALPRRFDIEPSHSLSRRYFNEEQYELIEASMVNSVSVEGDEWDELGEECFDVIYTALALLQAHGMSYKEFEKMAKNKIALNDAKTIQNGYGVVDRKIKPIS